MKISSWVKRIAAIILMACFFLPMSQCSKSYVAKDGTTFVEWSDIKAVSSFDNIDPETTFLENINSDIALAIFVFLWPVMLQLAAFKWKNLQLNYAFLFTELTLMVITCCYVFEMITMGNRVVYGAYVFAIASAAYTSITLYFIKYRISQMMKSRR
jgi:hypothetical protein